MEIDWHGLLNCPEATVLSATEERELLIELDDCRGRILAASPLTENDWGTSAPETSFQQRVRELASSPAGLDPLIDALQPLARRYEQVRSRLALANLRLVAHVAKRYIGRGIPPGDLLQEGICSLLSAIDRFEVKNQTRLATYAMWWIRQGLQRAIAAGAYPVRLNPRHLHRLAHLHRTQGDEPSRRWEFSRPPHVEGTASAPSQTLERLIAATRPTLSLDAASHYDGMTPVVDYLIPRDGEETQSDDLDESVGVLIGNLSPREQLILKLRFGLRGSEPQTLLQVGKTLGVSKERVRQIEARALRKLRAVGNTC
jgi:RNA polymerase primary sigma factor